MPNCLAAVLSTFNIHSYGILGNCCLGLIVIALCFRGSYSQVVSAQSCQVREGCWSWALASLHSGPESMGAP